MTHVVVVQVLNWLNNNGPVAQSFAGVLHALCERDRMGAQLRVTALRDFIADLPGEYP